MPSRHFRFLTFLAVALPLSAAEFPPLVNTEQDLSKPLMPAADAAAGLKMPEGFTATLFAAEPEVQNPIAVSWDARGRLWIAENFTYAERPQRFDLSMRDRVLIFEDTDGDGRADSRKVFTDEVQMLTSVAVGHGGVWLMCPPQLLFVPDADADGTPDGPPQVVLDGFTVTQANYHNFANGLKWGPDGWLYGRLGHYSPGSVGLPDTPPEKRAPLGGGMWRYHPARRVFEALNFGTTNPWGHDWDRHGELFFVNTVIGHLWHHIPGAHYRQPFSADPTPYVYDTIDQHADHYHFDTGKTWRDSRDGAGDDFGGGHAHIGMMIYQGDNWPAEWRDKLYTVNMHGRRVNTDRLERSGSGYTGKHDPDFLLAADPWFRGLDLTTGPDGGVFLIDWSDTGECHDYTGVHRESGRIFKITHREGKTLTSLESDISRLDSAALAGLQRHRNEWQVRESRRLLHERTLAGADVAPALAVLRTQLSDPDTVLRLRALWTLSLIGGMDEPALRALLTDPDEHVRTWALRLLTDTWPKDLCTAVRPQMPDTIPPPELLADFSRMAASDESGLVRLTLASTLQRLPLTDRPALAAALAARAGDADDHNLPLVVWHGLLPVATSRPDLLPAVSAASGWPRLRRWIARCLTEISVEQPAPLEALLTNSSTQTADVLTGMTEATTGWRKAARPAAWDAFLARVTATEDPAQLTMARGLSALFGDGRAMEEVRRLVLDKNTPVPARQAALRSLIEGRPDDLRKICEDLLSNRDLNDIAARGLALFDDPAVGRKLAGSWQRFSPDARIAVIDTLTSRSAFAAALLDEVQADHIPRNAITAFHARQIRSLGDAALTARLTEVWGELRESPADKLQQIAGLKAKLTTDSLAAADLSQGRALFQLCSACHTLYGEGGKTGPDLTGSGRGNLDYLLENIVDPSAVVALDYRMSVLTMKDGRSLSGVIAAQTERTLTLRTLTDTQSLDRADIAKTETLPVSMMPEGLLQALTEAQVRDLIAYLMHPTQVPLPAPAK